MKTSASSFLTFDLDYFFMGYADYSYKENPYYFMKKLINLSIPIHVFMEHHEVLNYMDKPYSTIYNVDFHSDIVHDPCTDLNEGTWANFYPYKNKAVFQWNYPEKYSCFDQGFGICDEFPKKWSTDLMNYKEVRRRSGITNIDYPTLSRIGISISPDWVDERVFDFMKSFSVFDSIIGKVYEKCTGGDKNDSGEV